LEFRRSQQGEALGDFIETVAAVGVAPVPPGRLGAPVQADAYPDPRALERGQHGTVEEGAVGLEGHVYLGGNAGAERADQAAQPLRPREQRLASVQDDVDAGEAMTCRVLGDALDSPVRHQRAHSLGQSPPALIRHFVHIAI
jgi:hypothetical protein